MWISLAAPIFQAIGLVVFARSQQQVECAVCLLNCFTHNRGRILTTVHSNQFGARRDASLCGGPVLSDVADRTFFGSDNESDGIAQIDVLVISLERGPQSRRGAVENE